MVGALLFRAADARAVIAALGIQGAVVVLIPDDKVAGIALFEAGMAVVTVELIVSIQLDDHVAIAGGGDAAHVRSIGIDICIGDRDIDGFLICHSDGQFPRAEGRVRRSDDRIVIRHGAAVLGHRLSVFFIGRHEDVPILQIPGVRQRGKRHQQHSQYQGYSYGQPIPLPRHPSETPSFHTRSPFIFSINVSISCSQRNCKQSINTKKNSADRVQRRYAVQWKSGSIRAVKDSIFPERMSSFMALTSTRSS